MPMNPNWPRWIKASVVKAFQTELGDNLQMFVEECTDRSVLQGDSDFCELRLDGPTGYERSLGEWELTIEINVLVSSIRSEKDAYQIDRNNGLVAQCFTNGITVFRYGTGEGDDSGEEGCLILRTDKNSGVVVSNFGAPPDVRILQSSIEGHYKGKFTTYS